MASDAAPRAVVAYLRTLGATDILVDTSRGKGQHYLVEFTTPGGRRVRYITAHNLQGRNVKNSRAELRRICRN
jgi:hypothetical protein